MTFHSNILGTHTSRLCNKSNEGLGILNIILASSSKTRKAVLEKLQLPFEISIPSVVETPLANEAPENLVERLSMAKARKVSEEYAQHLIIGSDQVAVVENRIVGKSDSRDEAIHQLQSASGKSIMLFTGLALLNSASDSIQSDVLPYRVVFRELTLEMIENYIDKDQPYDCGGGLRSEGLGVALLKEFDGSDPNILLGLPLIRLIDMLANEGVYPLQGQS